MLLENKEMVLGCSKRRVGLKKNDRDNSLDTGLEIPEFLQSSIGIYSHWWGWKPWPC
jgi:hypothetical protein